MDGNKGKLDDDGKGTILFSGTKIKSKTELLQAVLEP